MEAGKNGGLEDLLGDMNLGDLDFGSLMKDLDPEVLQDLVMEGLKDPQIQEMVWLIVSTVKCVLVLFRISLFSHYLK